MSVALYMDHVPAAITKGLPRRGVDVVTTEEDGTAALADPLLLECARSFNRVLFTLDQGFLGETARRQQTGEDFAGVVFAHQRRLSIRRCIDDLELIAKASDPSDWLNQLKFLPL